MATGFIDALTSPTLKHLREHWWNDAFTEFLTETLRPRAGNRILDVGCGEGMAEVQFGRLNVSQMRLVGVDLKIEHVIVARRETAAHNQRGLFASADACHLPFRDGSFDSTFCVAVLQHIRGVDMAIRDFARVTRWAGASWPWNQTTAPVLVFVDSGRTMRVRDVGALLCGARGRARRGHGCRRRAEAPHALRILRHRAARGAALPRVTDAAGRARG